MTETIDDIFLYCPIVKCYCNELGKESEVELINRDPSHWMGVFFFARVMSN